MNCNGLTNVTIGNGLTTIGNYAFNYSGLMSIIIGNSVTNIGTCAFRGCGDMTSVSIGNSVSGIGSSAFGECWSLSALTVAASNPFYSSTNGVLFDKSHFTLIQFPGGKGGSYTIPDSVTNIGNSALLPVAAA